MLLSSKITLREADFRALAFNMHTSLYIGDRHTLGPMSKKRSVASFVYLHKTMQLVGLRFGAGNVRWWW